MLLTHFKKIAFTFLITIIAVTSVSDAFAAPEKKKERQTKKNSEIVEPVITEKGTYYPVSVKRLASLYWKYGIHDVTNERAVNELLYLQDCHVYGEYFYNDFLWQRILRSKIQEIENFKDSFVSRFVLSDVVYLNRFDFEESKFLLDKNSAFRNMGYITLSDTDTYDIKCPGGHSLRNAKSYPPRMSAILEDPVDISAIPLSKRKALEIVEKLAAKPSNDRVMYSRVYLNIIGVEQAKVRGVFSDMVEFKARIDRIEVFEDIENQKMVYERNF